MDVDVVLAGEEKAVPYREVGEEFLFLLGELEDIREDIDGRRVLFQEELHRGVGDDGAAHFRGHEIFDVLSDGGEAEIILPGALGKGEEEVCGIFVVH